MLRRGDERDLFVFGEIDLVVPRAPRAAVRGIPPLLFQLIVEILGNGLDRERRRMIANDQSNGRYSLASVHLEIPLMREQDRLLRHGAIHRCLMHANRDHRTEPEADRLGCLHQRVGDKDRVLLVGHEQPLFEHDVLERVLPHRQTADQTKVVHDDGRALVVPA